MQRVPVTETQGRLHTSTASVVVLPEADEVCGQESGGVGALQRQGVAMAVRALMRPCALGPVARRWRFE